MVEENVKELVEMVKGNDGRKIGRGGCRGVCPRGRLENMKGNGGVEGDDGGMCVDDSSQRM